MKAYPSANTGAKLLKMALVLIASPLFLVTTSLQAESIDVLFLSDGRVLAGTFESKDRKNVSFRPRNQETVTADAKDMTGLILGYEGLPACLSFRSHPDERDCSFSILAFGPRFLFATRDGLRDIDQDEIHSLTFQKTEAKQPLLPLLRTGTEISISRMGRQIRGTVFDTGLESFKVHLSDESSITVNENQASGGSLFQPDRNSWDVLKESWAEDPLLFVPGIYAFRSGKTFEGSAFSGVFALSIAMGFYYQKQALLTADKSKTDPAYRILGYGSYPNEYRGQIQMRNTMWGLSLGTFLFHTFRLVWLRRWIPGILEIHLAPGSVGAGFQFTFSPPDV